PGGVAPVTGLRLRQALASPQSVFVHDSSAALVKRAQGLGLRAHVEAFMKTTIARAITALSTAALLSGCAASLRNPDIADVQRNAGHYADRTVTIDGTVTNSWGVPLVPFKLSKVDDGTGEITVLSRGSRTPARGERLQGPG